MTTVMARNIVIGDVHGCLAELQVLLTEVVYRPSEDRLFLLGDLVDRGPQSVGTVRYVRGLVADHGATCLMGNHEEKYVRYHRWEQKRAATGTRNPMRLSVEKRAIYASFNEADHAWLAGLPYYHAENGFLLVHAGVCPRRHRTLEDLDRLKYRDRLLRLRDIDAQGRMVALDRRGQPGQQHWSETYDGRLGFVIYGHQVYDDVRERKASAGIDTGCCFGGKLTAMVFSTTDACRYVSVSACAKHAAYIEDD